MPQKQGCFPSATHISMKTEIHSQSGLCFLRGFSGIPPRDLRSKHVPPVLFGDSYSKSASRQNETDLRLLNLDL